MADTAVRVRVELYAGLRRRAAGGPAGTPGPPEAHAGRLECALPPGATVADLLARLDVAPDTDLVVGVNGTLGSRRSTLADGDEVVLVPPLRGGGRDVDAST